MDRRDTYEEGKESTLVRILLKTLPKEYDPAVKEVQALVRLRKAGAEGQLGFITNLEDSVNKNYSVDWLPPYNELRVELIASYRLMERRRKEDGKSQKGGHPALPILSGHEQPGPHQRKCYGCGKMGHMRGDQTCTAGPNGVWEGAPQIWKDRVKKAGQSNFGKGAGKPTSKVEQRNKGKRDSSGKPLKDQPCHNWTRGNGFCKFADACRYSHEGPKGDPNLKGGPGQKRKIDAVFMATKKGKKARKQLASLLMKDIKAGGKAKAKDTGKNTDEDDHLYELIRGVPTVMINAKGDEFDDFVPRRNSKRKCEPYDSDEDNGSNDSHTSFTVTLMMTDEDDKNDESEDFVPSRGNSKIETSKESKLRIKSSNNGRVISNSLFSQDEKSISPQNNPDVSIGDLPPKEEIDEVLGSRRRRRDLLSSPSEDGETKRRNVGDQRGQFGETSVLDWKARAERAERLVLEMLEDKHKHERSQARIGRRQKLSDTLDLLTNNEPPLDPDVGVEYIVLRRLNKGKDWVCVDFVDGDDVDDKEWCEGPFHQQMSIRELFGKKHRYDRRTRRGITGRKKVPRGESSSDSEDSTSSSDEEGSEGDEGDAPVEEAGEESDGTEDYVNESSSTTAEKRSVEYQQGDRRGGYRSGNSMEESEELRRSPPVKERDLSPQLTGLKWKRSKSWREDFRRQVMPSLPGVDVKSLFTTIKKGVRDAVPRYDCVYCMEEKRTSPHLNNCPMPLLWHKKEEVRVAEPRALRAKCSTCGTKNCNAIYGEPCNMREMMVKARGSFRAQSRPVRNPTLMVSQCDEFDPDGILSLHPMEYVGIDTCSARSVSSEIADFLYLDRSENARNSVSLNGVGEGGPEVLARGPMLISTYDDQGRQTFLLDPGGVLIASSEKQARLRIFGQQRVKRFGYHVVQDYVSNTDTLNYKDNIKIPLETIRGILMVKTIPWNMNPKQMERLNDLVDDVIARKVDDYCFQITEEVGEENTLPLLMMNEAKLSRVEKNRIWHWRHAHRAPTGERYTERCHTCEASKHKSVFKPNAAFNGTTVSTNVPYWRLYSDAYGGQRSLGVESYEGGIGGFVFACPVSGTIKVKVYSTLKQYPAVMYQVLQEIESEGYVCREIYCDTASINLSQAVEEVAEMFRVRVIPISGGTPQELAYAESAVRTLGQMSRSQMLGAPHLPQFVWGMSDINAAWVHRTLPQKNKNWKSPFEITTGRVPDDDMLFIKVFGCPCQYEPAYGVEHKRAAKTEWGWFVGVQWPMVLILRPEDNKVLSISRKKVHCHEAMYAKFDAENQTRPRIEFKDFTLNRDEVDAAICQARQHDEASNEKQVEDSVMDAPKHVLSVKVLSDSKRNQRLLSPNQQDVPVAMANRFHEAEGSGENTEPEIPESLKFQEDLQLDELKGRRKRLK